MPTAYTWTGAHAANPFAWSDAGNWSPGGIPGAADSAAFSAGTTTCNIDSGVTVGSLAVTSSWSGGINVNAPLTVTGDLILDFHPATGTFGGDGAMTIDGAGSRWTNGTLNVGAGGFTNNGTFEIDTGASGVYASGTGTLTNDGTIQETGSDDLRLARFNTVTLNNAGLYELTSDCGIAGSDGPVLVNSATGTIAKTGGSGTSTLAPGLFRNLGGTLKATSGTMQLGSPGALIDGATLVTGPGATLGLASGWPVTYQGTVTGSGAGKILLDNGVLVVGSSGLTFNMPVSTLFQWTSGGSIDVSSGGTFTNPAGSTLNVSATGIAASLTGAGALVNNGVINETGNVFVQLTNGATLTNNKTYNLKSDAGIGVSGGGTLVNAGTLHKTAGTGTSTISAPLNNTGTLSVSSGTVHVSGAVTQISSGVLNAGKWTVSVSGSKHGTLTLDSAFSTIGSHAVVTLNGVNAAFTNMPGLAGIAAGGSLVLNGGASLSTTGNLTNNGKLTVDAGGILTVGGTFTQTSTATFTVQIKFSSSPVVPTFGHLVVAAGGGGASLAGKLVLTVSGMPNISSQLMILNDLSSMAITGMFSNVGQDGTLTVLGHAYHIHYGSSAVTVTT